MRPPRNANLIVPHPPMPEPVPRPIGPHLFPGVPVGSVMAFAGTLTPTGTAAGDHETDLTLFLWRNCDGSKLNKRQFPQLFKVLGHTYGGSDDEFHLPCYGGQFFRALTTSPKLDPDIDGRTRYPDGKGETAGVGSMQPFALQQHKHGSTASGPGTGGKGVGDVKYDADGTTDVVTNASSVDVLTSDYETRPQNIYVNWIIKVAYAAKDLPAGPFG